MKKVDVEGGASWTADELKPVEGAFVACSPADQNDPKAIVVNRVLTLNDDPNSAAVCAEGAKKAVAAQKVPQSVVDASQNAIGAVDVAADCAAKGTKRASMSAQEQRDAAGYCHVSDAVEAEIKAYAGAIKAGKVGVDSSQKHPGDMDAALELKVQTRDVAGEKLEPTSKTKSHALPAGREPG